MSGDWNSIHVPLPAELVADLDELVESGAFSSRSEALRYGVRLVLREQRLDHFPGAVRERARQDVRDRLERKRFS